MAASEFLPIAIDLDAASASWSILTVLFVFRLSPLCSCYAGKGKEVLPPVWHESKTSLKVAGTGFVVSLLPRADVFCQRYGSYSRMRGAGTMPATGCASRKHWHSGHSSPWLLHSMLSGKLHNLHCIALHCNALLSRSFAAVKAPQPHTVMMSMLSRLHASIKDACSCGAEIISNGVLLKKSSSQLI